MTGFIALTGMDDAATHVVIETLARGITERDAHVAILGGVRNALEAQAVYANHGELWCVGDEPADDDLVPLVDRTIKGDTPEQLRASTRQALAAFLGKTRVSA
jgi:hypothetical protein